MVAVVVCRQLGHTIERAAPAAGEPYEIRGVVGDEVWRLIDAWAEAQELGGATSSGLSKPPSLKGTE